METLVLDKITEFMEELNNRKAGKVDIIVPTNNITMDESGKIHITNTANPNDVNQTAYEFTPTEWAHTQIAEKLKIPKNYYDRMKVDASTTKLLADNVNTWMQKIKELKLIRAWNEEMIALLSNRYMAIDNYDVADIVIKTVYAQKQKIVMNKAYVDDKVMNFQLIDPETVYTPFSENPKDVYFPGVNVRNSEVGYAAFLIEPFLYRGICSNGLIYGFQGIKQIHAGIRKDEGMYWSNTTTELEKMTTLSKVKDVIQLVFSADFYNEVMDRFKTLKTENLPLKVVNASLKLLGLSEDEGKDIYKKIEGNSRYDFIQAITSKANDYLTPQSQNPERSYEMQKMGGQLITDLELWKKIEKESEKL